MSVTRLAYRKSAPSLILFCGLSCSGKSTAAQSLLLAAPAWAGVTLLSSDDRLEVRAASAGIDYQEAWVRWHAEVLNELFSDCRSLLAEGQTVLWDQTHLTVEDRAKRLALAADGTRTVALVFEVELDAQARRLAARESATGKHIPAFVLDRQREAWTPPSSAEGFDLVLDGTAL